MSGHSPSDSSTYRTQEEIDAWKACDPVAAFGRKLVSIGVASESELEAVDAMIVDRMTSIMKLAINDEIDTPRGLIVPTLFSADTLTLNELSGKAKELIKAAQAGSISPDLLTGGSFTVTNLGSLGVESFTGL